MPPPMPAGSEPYVELMLDGQYVILFKHRAFGMLDEVLQHHPEFSRTQARAYSTWRIIELMSPLIRAWAEEWEHQTHD